MHLISYAETSFFYLAYAFGGGVLVGYLYTHSDWRIRTVIGGASLVLLITLASLVSNKVMTLPDVPLLYNSWNWYAGIGILAVFVCLFSPLTLNQRLKRFLLHYGDISYSTYLYHNLLIGAATLLCIQNNIHSAPMRVLITSVFALGGTFVLAVLSFRYIETPCIKLGRHISKKLM